MKKYNNIDELFKDELLDHRVVPDTNLWPEMEKAIFKPKRSKWIFLLPLLLIGIPIAFLSIQHFDKNDQPNEVINNIAVYPITEENIFIDSIAGKNKINDTNNNLIILNEADYKSETEENIATDINISDTVINLIDNVYLKQDEQLMINEYYRQKTINERKTGYLTLNNNKSIESANNDINIPALYNKKQKLSIYSFVSASVGMAYYSSSSDKFTWSADMGAGYKIGKFYVETGIGFQQMKENGYYRIDYSSEDSVGYYNKVVSFELDPVNPGQIQYNIKQTTVYDSVDHYTHASPTYTYHYINIPLTIGYRFYNSDKFNISFQSGVIFSILNKTIIPEFTFNDPETKLIGITNLTSPKASNNIRLQVGLRINAKVFRGVSLSVQPEFTRWLNSINTDASDKSMPYTMSIRAGIYYNF